MIDEHVREGKKHQHTPIPTFPHEIDENQHLKPSSESDRCTIDWCISRKACISVKEETGTNACSSVPLRTMYVLGKPSSLYTSDRPSGPITQAFLRPRGVKALEHLYEKRLPEGRVVS